MFVQWAGQKWESISEYLITEHSGMVIMKGFEIEGLSDAPDTHGDMYRLVRKSQNKKVSWTKPDSNCQGQRNYIREMQQLGRLEKVLSYLLLLFSKTSHTRPFSGFFTFKWKAGVFSCRTWIWTFYLPYIYILFCIARHRNTAFLDGISNISLKTEGLHL